MSAQARQYLRVKPATKKVNTPFIISQASTQRDWKWLGFGQGTPSENAQMTSINDAMKYSGKKMFYALGDMVSAGWIRNAGTPYRPEFQYKVYNDTTIPAAYGSKIETKPLGRVDAARKALEATQRLGKDELKIPLVQTQPQTSVSGTPTSSFFSFDPMDLNNSEMVSGLRRRREPFGELAINPAGAQTQVF